MSYFIGLFVFILGMLVGSFLNVVILRYNTGKTIDGRSGCFSCGKQLRWYELIPVFSFLMQKGKCRGCAAKISWQYALVELLTGSVFLVVFLKELSAFSFVSAATVFAGYGSGTAAILSMLVSGQISGLAPFIFAILFYWAVFSLLIVILVYDIRHKIIPNALVYAFIMLSFVALFLSGLGGQGIAVQGIGMQGAVSQSVAMGWPHFLPFISSGAFWVRLAAGPLLFAPFFLLWFVSQGRWIGLGDGKLAWGIGWLFGVALGLSALAYAFWIGAILGIALLVFRPKRFTMKSEIPFAPFIILAIFLVYCFHVNVIDLFSPIHYGLFY